MYKSLRSCCCSAACCLECYSGLGWFLSCLRGHETELYHGSGIFSVIGKQCWSIEEECRDDVLWI